MKSATQFVVFCVLMFFVMHNAKVEAKDRPPVLVEFIPGKLCNPIQSRGAQQCKDETRDPYYPHCVCINVQGGHDCSCNHS
ncbi:hypothetical protein ISN44_As07g026350 [Arabidopsis suecica]|uniref:Uncharacterized protein n=1 Tax=Arabidopsis suecica TaxID=45249 RepID=A0A8T2C001_ARASU|nr:hypothetical protein ISN44_As07g026350 [Arabidopsis suecica]